MKYIDLITCIYQAIDLVWVVEGNTNLTMEEVTAMEDLHTLLKDSMDSEPSMFRPSCVPGDMVSIQTHLGKDWTDNRLQPQLNTRCKVVEVVQGDDGWWVVIVPNLPYWNENGNKVEFPLGSYRYRDFSLRVLAHHAPVEHFPNE